MHTRTLPLPNNETSTVLYCQRRVMKKATVWHNLSFNGRASVKWRKIETYSEFLNAFANASGPRLDTYKGFPHNIIVQQSCEPRYLVDDDDRWRVEIQNIPKKCSQTLPETKDDLRRYSQHFFLAGRKSQEKSAEKKCSTSTHKTHWQTGCDLSKHGLEIEHAKQNINMIDTFKSDYSELHNVYLRHAPLVIL